LSDLASSCEFLNAGGSCSVFSDNSRVQVNRRLKCVNSQKSGCCYLCLFRSQCSVGCNYLGRSEGSVGLGYVSDGVGCGVVDKSSVESGSFEGVSVVVCSSCNVEMVWAKVCLPVDDWHGDVSFLVSEKLLPVIVFLCPCCGRVEFKGDVVVKRGVEG